MRSMDTGDMGRRLRKCRAENGWAIKECAERIGIMPRYLSDIERGDKIPNLDTFILMLNVLGASADEVLQNSLAVGYVPKSSELERKLRDLTPEQRRQVTAVLESLLSSFRP